MHYYGWHNFRMFFCKNYARKMLIRIFTHTPSNIPVFYDYHGDVYSKLTWFHCYPFSIQPHAIDCTIIGLLRIHVTRLEHDPSWHVIIVIIPSPSISSRSLKCDRLRVHKNFMLSLVIRYIISIVYYEPYIYGNEDAKPWYHGTFQVCSQNE